MKSVLVLGATGFVGRSITDKLDSEGINWLGVSKETTLKNKPIVTLNDRSEISSFLSKEPAVVVASGGLKPRDYIVDTISAVATGWQTIQEVLSTLDLGCPSKVLLISSAGTVYGEAIARSSEECDIPQPVTWYGRHKLTEELLFANYCQIKEIPYVIARVSNPYGNSGVINHGFVDVLVDFVNKGKPFEASFHPESERDFIHCSDMAKKIVDLIEVADKGVFNLGYGKSVKLIELLDYVKGLHPSALVRYGEPTIHTDIIKSRISTKKDRSNSSL